LPMERYAKITQIMELAGVAPDDRDDARRNYEELSEAKIDDWLDRLNRGANAVKAWRAAEDEKWRRVEQEPRASAVRPKRKTLWEWIEPFRPTPEPAWAAGLPTRNQFARQLNALKRMNRHYAALTNGLEARSGRSGWSDSISRQLSRRIGEMVAGSSGVALSEFLVPIIEQLASSDKTVVAQASHQLDEFFTHPFLPEGNPRLTAAGTVEALARIENVIASEKPDAIVAINEGEVICSLIVEDLKLDAPIVHVRESPESGIRWIDDISALSSAKTICVMGHFARTGETLRKTMDEARARSRAEKVFGAVLVSSVDALGRVGAHCTYHQLVSGSKIDLAFDPSKGMKIENDTFILGGASDMAGNALPIPRAMLDRSRSDMKTLYPVDPLA
jgi:hypothetical protein